MGGYFEKKYITDYNNLQEIDLEYLEKLVFLRSSSYPLEECFDCPHAISQICHGGCIAQRFGKQEKPLLIDEFFFEIIPFMAKKFQMKKIPVNQTNSNGAGAEYLLIDKQAGHTYPLDQSLSSLLNAADGCRTLEDLYRLSFSDYENEKVARLAFKKIVTDLIAQNVLVLRPLKKFPMGRSGMSKLEHEL
jgi:hypothetical protein